MSWLRRLFGQPPELGANQAAALAAYLGLPPLPESSSLETLRFVVADVETTGLNPVSDTLISIGAISVERRVIRLSSAFQVVLRQPQASATANILIHGIDGTTQLEGEDPVVALLDFLEYAGNAPIVGFHSGFDRVMIERTCRGALGAVPKNLWLDLDYLAPTLFAPARTTAPAGLDDWLLRFGITNQARHNALADALATAQLLQVVMAQAIAGGARTLADLVSLEQDQRWLRQVT